MVTSNRELHLLDGKSALSLIANDEISVTQYIQSLLQRIRQRDAVTKAWAYLDEDLVLKCAKELDALPREERGPLHGLPVAVKDVILTKDMPTRYNSAIYADEPAQGIDATCVAVLRAAGAVILVDKHGYYTQACLRGVQLLIFCEFPTSGKTKTTEFAATPVGTDCTNPHDPSRTPGGSSSGSGAVVADFQAPISLGTQTGGSVIRPGSFNGVLAFKPTWNALSREGLKIHALTLDTLGFFARSVDDLNLMAQLFRLQDDPSPSRPPLSLSTMRIALCKTPMWEQAGPGTQEAITRGAEILRNHGVTVDEITLPEDFATLPKWQDVILRGEGRSSFLHYATSHKAQLKPLLVDYVMAPVEEYPRSEQLAAYDRAARLRPIFDEIASEYDAILCPSVIDEAPVGLQHTGSYIFNALWTLLHVPVVNVPGFAGPNGMPVGLSLVQGRYQDMKLLEVAQLCAEIFQKEGGFQSSIPS